jgi:hypothetical protein
MEGEETNAQVETTNINFKWLENIYEQLKNIQDMERLALEGCGSLMEYLQVPYEMQLLLLPEVQYKNLKFICREINILTDNLSPILKEKTKSYKEKLKPVLDDINNRGLFLKEVRRDNKIFQLTITPLFGKTINYVCDIKSQLINDIGHILYLPNEDKKKSW